QLIVAKLEWRFDFTLNFQAPIGDSNLGNREVATNVEGFVRRGKAIQRREWHFEIERLLFANDQTGLRHFSTGNLAAFQAWKLPGRLRTSEKPSRSSTLAARLARYPVAQ